MFTVNYFPLKYYAFRYFVEATEDPIPVASFGLTGLSGLSGLTLTFGPVIHGRK
jgi:hypothetical protein